MDDDQAYSIGACFAAIPQGIVPHRGSSARTIHQPEAALVFHIQGSKIASVLRYPDLPTAIAEAGVDAGDEASIP